MIFLVCRSVVNYEQAQIDMERKLEEGQIETEEQLQQMQQKVTDHGLNTMWKIGKLEVWHRIWSDRDRDC